MQCVLSLEYMSVCLVLNVGTRSNWPNRADRVAFNPHRNYYTEDEIMPLNVQ